MADETETPLAPSQQKGPAQVASVRWSNPQVAQEFAEVLAHRQRKGKSKSASDLIEQMFQYLKDNPYSDFPTGR